MTSLALVRAGSVEERDPFWQIRAGTENLAGWPLVRPDSWSWAPADEPFRQTSPGWNTLLALAWEAGGYTGVFALGILSIAGLAACTAALSRVLGAGAVATLIGMLVSFGAALAMLSIRASLVAHTLFLGGLLVVFHLSERWRRTGRRPPSLAVGAAAASLTALGNWLHLSWLMFTAMTAFSWTLILVSRSDLRSWHRRRLATAVSLGCVAGLAVGPHGSQVLAYSTYVRTQCEGVITEWMSVFTPGLTLRWLPLTVAAMVACIFGLLAVWRLRADFGTDARLPLSTAFLVIGGVMAVASLDAVRFAGAAVLVLAPMSGPAVQKAARKVRRWGGARKEHPGSDHGLGRLLMNRVRHWTHAGPWAVVLWIVLLLVSPGVLAMARPMAQPLPELAIMANLPSNCRLFSNPAIASTIILERPDVGVWIDGRADYYGPERAIATTIYLSGAGDVPVPPGTTCIITDRTSPLQEAGLDERLRADADWTLLAERDGLNVWAADEGSG